MKNKEESGAMRLDKWLWCSRFYKTRSLATAAIKAGKIRNQNGQLKPASTVRPGETLRIKRGPYHYDITVSSLARTRGPAAEAENLYEENRESIEAREKLAEQIKLNAQNQTAEKGRPSKRRRRQIIRFTRRSA